MAILKKTIDRDRIYFATDRNLYELLNTPAAKIIGSSCAVDPDNGRVCHSLHMGSSDVLGILLNLEHEGYSIKRNPWFIPRRIWDRL